MTNDYLIVRGFLYPYLITFVYAKLKTFGKLSFRFSSVNSLCFANKRITKCLNSVIEGSGFFLF